MKALTFEHLSANDMEEAIAYSIQSDYLNDLEVDESDFEDGEVLAKYKITVTVEELD